MDEGTGRHNSSKDHIAMKDDEIMGQLFHSDILFLYSYSYMGQLFHSEYSDTFAHMSEDLWGFFVDPTTCVWFEDHDHDSVNP